MSADGRYVVFCSFSIQVTPPDTNSTSDVFLRDRLLGTTERVSLTKLGKQANGYSQGPIVTPDGRFVVFQSYATNLTASDANGAEGDVYLRDRTGNP